MLWCAVVMWGGRVKSSTIEITVLHYHVYTRWDLPEVYCALAECCSGLCVSPVPMCGLTRCSVGTWRGAECFVS